MIGGHRNFQGPGNFQGPELLAAPGKFQDPGYFQAPLENSRGVLISGQTRCVFGTTLPSMLQSLTNPPSRSPPKKVAAPPSKVLCLSGRLSGFGGVEWKSANHVSWFCTARLSEAAGRTHAAASPRRIRPSTNPCFDIAQTAFPSSFSTSTPTTWPPTWTAWVSSTSKLVVLVLVEMGRLVAAGPLW